MSKAAYTVEVAKQITDVDPAEWDALCSERPSVNHRWLRLTESVLADHEPYYIQLREGQRLAAAAVCSVRRNIRSPAAGVSQVLNSLARELLRGRRVLVCGVPISFGPGLLIHPDYDCAELVPRVLKAIDGLARQKSAPSIQVEHLADSDIVWPALSAAHYHHLHSPPESILEVCWATFEEYETSLPSRKRRELRRYGRRAREANVTLETVHPSPEMGQLLRPLVGNVFARHGGPDIYAADLFGRALAVLGDDLTLLVARRHERPVGCMALLRNGAELMPRFLGLDYREAMNSFVYHGLMTECVARSIQLRVRRIWLGSHSYQIKRDLGAHLDNRYVALAMRNRLLNRLLGAGFALMRTRLPSTR